jgi:hypothetical protein
MLLVTTTLGDGAGVVVEAAVGAGVAAPFDGLADAGVMEGPVPEAQPPRSAATVRPSRSRPVAWRAFILQASRNAFAGRTRQWLGAVPAARVWAACQSLSRTTAA